MGTGGVARAFGLLEAKPRPPPQSPATIELDRTEKFSPIARVMNRTMTAALQIPHFGYKDEVDMSALVRLRKQLKHQVGQTINTKRDEKSLISQKRSGLLEFSVTFELC